ncbi:hypothetical protein BGY98DRAFT_989548 [Russula aff. rugulosa BPL654]|nr:hypothetical protein BGY98DRAFT_989548 [Russula aff. rugulosa BPL654]
MSHPAVLKLGYCRIAVAWGSELKCISSQTSCSTVQHAEQTRHPIRVLFTRNLPPHCLRVSLCHAVCGVCLLFISRTRVTGRHNSDEGGASFQKRYITALPGGNRTIMRFITEFWMRRVLELTRLALRTLQENGPALQDLHTAYPYPCSTCSKQGC